MAHIRDFSVLAPRCEWVSSSSRLLFSMLLVLPATESRIRLLISAPKPIEAKNVLSNFPDCGMLLGILLFTAPSSSLFLGRKNARATDRAEGIGKNVCAHRHNAPRAKHRSKFLGREERKKKSFGDSRSGFLRKL